MDLSKVILEDSSKLTLVKYEKTADNSSKVTKLGGQYNADTKIFSAYINEAGNYGIMEATSLTKMNLAIGNNMSIINGEETINDVAPEIINGMTVVPLRLIAESLGAEVKWNAATKEAIISLDGKTITVGQAEGIIIKNSRTLVPIRYVSESLGAHVLWIPSSKEIQIVR